MTHQFKARVINWRERADRLLKKAAENPGLLEYTGNLDAHNASVRADIYLLLANELDWLADNYQPARGERMPETRERFDYMMGLCDDALQEANAENGKLRNTISNLRSKNDKWRKTVVNHEATIVTLMDEVRTLKKQLAGIQDLLLAHPVSE